MADRMQIADFTITVTLTEDDEIVSLESSDGIGYSQGLGWLHMAIETWQQTHGLKVSFDDE